MQFCCSPLNARSLAPRDLAPTMGQDEYSEDRRGGLALEALVVPALVLFASVCAAFTMSSKSMSLSKAYAFASELTEKNQILQAFIGSSLLGVFSYSLMLAGRTLISWFRGRTFCSITISNKDESFNKLIDFIGKQGIVTSGCLVASTFQKKKTWKDCGAPYPSSSWASATRQKWSTSPRTTTTYTWSATTASAS